MDSCRPRRPWHMLGSLHFETTGDQLNEYCATPGLVWDSAILSLIFQYFWRRCYHYLPAVQSAHWNRLSSLCWNCARSRCEMVNLAHCLTAFLSETILVSSIFFSQNGLMVPLFLHSFAASDLRTENVEKSFFVHSLMRTAATSARLSGSPRIGCESERRMSFVSDP